jgi:pyridoxal phosphate enzyme (YggS family)
MSELEARLQSVRERIAAAAKRSGRDPAEVTLVTVTKMQPPAVVQAAYDLGLRHFGENRVGEAEEKVGDLPADITWHMIGHIQSRKAKRVVPLFDVVHSVDSVKLAGRLSRMAAERPTSLPILLELNVSGEASKHGFAADREVPLDAVEQIVALPHLDVQGLMTMAPIVPDPDEARPVFARLRQVRDELTVAFPHVDWRHLSMGMTDDFEVAIQEGATMVRVGRAIFDPHLAQWRMG